MRKILLTILFSFTLLYSFSRQFTPNNPSSGINVFMLNDEQVNNLALACKVWGFVKYYHPSVATGRFNMDVELFDLIKQLQPVTDQKTRNSILGVWLSKFGEINEIAETKLDPSSIKLKPDFTWMNGNILGDSLIKQLKKVINAKRIDSHHYFQLQDAKNVIIRNEESYNATPYPDAGIRLLALFRYWNFVEYFFPYKNLIPGNWNDVLVKYIPLFLNSRDELEYKLNCLSLITNLKDTHANIYNDNTIQRFKGSRVAPVNIRFIENKAIVHQQLPVLVTVQHTLQPGDVLDSINGRSIEELVKDKMPYTSASNYPTALRNIAMELLATEDTILRVVITRNGIKKAVDVYTYTANTVETYSVYEKKADTCFKMITPDIAYLYAGNIKNSYLPRLVPEILKTKGLIIDLRCYPSEFIVFSLTQYLVPNPVPFVKFSNTSYQHPGLFTYTKPVFLGKKNKDYYKGKVIILVNEITQSQAEYTAMALQRAPGATVIGSTTAGADGNISRLPLPGGVQSIFSGIGVYYPDGKETQQIGIVPDIEIKPTIKGIQENRDELLEKAIEIIEKMKN